MPSLSLSSSSGNERLCPLGQGLDLIGCRVTVLAKLLIRLLSRTAKRFCHVLLEVFKIRGWCCGLGFSDRSSVVLSVVFMSSLAF